MEWLLKGMREREEIERKKSAVADGGALLWKGLTDRIHLAQIAYTAKYPPLPGGMQIVYITAAGANPYLKRETVPAAGAAPTEVDRVTLQYHAPATVTASYTSGISPVVLTVALAPAGHATLQYNAKEITLDGACELILRPILFYDLPPLKL
jgi:hypothetical protein